MALTHNQVAEYLKREGYPGPDSVLVDIFMNAGKRQHQYDECVINQYAMPDFDRWMHLQDVLGIELSYQTAMAIDGALHKENLETMELKTPEDHFKNWEREFLQKEETPGKITKNITLTMDSKIARKALAVAGFGFQEMNQATDQEVFEMVMSTTVCSSGITFQEILPGKMQDQNKEDNMFVFDDELYGTLDDTFEYVDGYLWATDALVAKLRAQEDPELFKDADNINFYARFNVKNRSIEVDGTYYTFNKEDNEIQQEFKLSLSSDEKDSLISEMEAYCQKTYNLDCLGFVNDFRQSNGLPPIADIATIEAYKIADPPVNLHTYTVAYVLHHQDYDFQFGMFSAEQPSADWIRKSVQDYLSQTHTKEDAILALLGVNYLYKETSNASGDKYIDSDELLGEDAAEFFMSNGQMKDSLDKMIQMAKTQTPTKPLSNAQQKEAVHERF